MGKNAQLLNMFGILFRVVCQQLDQIYQILPL